MKKLFGISKFQKASVWYLACNFINKGFPLFIMAVIVRKVTEGEYGYYTNFNTWMAVLQIVVTLSLYTSVNKAKYEFKDKFEAYNSSILILGTIATLLFGGIFLIFPNKTSHLFSIQKKHLFFLFLFFIVWPAFPIYQVRERIHVRYKNYTYITVLMAAVSVLMSLLGITIFKDKQSGLVLGRIIPMMIISFCLYVSLLKKGKTLYQKDYWSFAAKIAIPLIPHELSMILLSTSDRILIEKLCGTGDVARYAVVYTCATGLSMITNSLNLAFSPWMYEKLQEKKFEEIKKQAGNMILVLSGVAIILMLLGPEMIFVFGGKKYLNASMMIPSVVLGLLVQAAYIPFVILELNEKKTYLISRSTCFAAGLNLVLNYIFIPIYGYQAASYTTLIGYLCLYFLHYRNSKKLKSEAFADQKLYFIIFTSMAALGVICLKLYKIELSWF